MVEVYAIKNEHTIYRILRGLGAGIEHDISIIGLDSPLLGIKDPEYGIDIIGKYLEKPFFLYIEEYATFGGHVDHKVDASTLAMYLNHQNFLGFISHIKSTCKELYTEYGVRCYHLPLSSHDKDRQRVVERINSLKTGRPINLMAWSSWMDVHDHNFYNRGGPIIDGLMMSLQQEDVDVNLIFRTTRSGLNCKIWHSDRVEIIDQYLEDDEVEETLYRGDIYLLPSRQLHSITLTSAFSYGMPCVVDEGWGFSEFCVDGLNCLIESNDEYYTGEGEGTLGEYISKISDRLAHLCKNRELLAKMSENTLAWYDANHSRENHKRNFVNLINRVMHRHNLDKN